MYGRIPIERIELVGVGKVFGATAALRSVCASLESGPLHLVLGANGSGKSTFLKLNYTNRIFRTKFHDVLYSSFD